MARRLTAGAGNTNRQPPRWRRMRITQRMVTIVLRACTIVLMNCQPIGWCRACCPYLGLDHERLTYHFSVRDYRLTDVHGQVVKALIK